MAILTIKSAADETAVVEQNVLELARINGGKGGAIELAISILDQQVIDNFILNIDAICRVISCIAPPLYTKLVLPADFWQQIGNLVSIQDKDLAITKIIDAIPAGLDSIDIHHLIHPSVSLGYIDIEPMLKKLATKGAKELCLPDGAIKIACKNKLKFQDCQRIILSSDDALSLDIDTSSFQKVMMRFPSLNEIKIINDFSADYNKRIEESLNLKILATKRDKKLTLPIGSIDIICSHEISFKSCREVVLSLTDARRLDSDTELLKQIKRSMPSLRKISIADGNDEAYVKSLNSKVKPKVHSFLGIVTRTNETKKAGHRRNRSISAPR